MNIAAKRIVELFDSPLIIVWSPSIDAATMPPFAHRISIRAGFVLESRFSDVLIFALELEPQNIFFFLLTIVWIS